MKGKWFIAGALIVAELALCAGIVGALWVGAAGLGGGRIRLGDFRQENFSATADEEERFTVDGPAVLEVNKGDQSVFGDVTVTGGPGDAIVVTAHKTAWGADQASADAALATLKVVVTQKGNTVTVRVDRPEEVISVSGNQTDRVDFTITVPTETSVDAATGFGDVSLIGVSGDVHLKADFGQITVKKVRGGDVSVRSDFGELSLEDIEAEDVDVNTNSGQISLTEVEATGKVELASNFGEVKFEDGKAKTLSARTNSGDVELSDVAVKESVTARSDFGQVTLTSVAASSYELRSNSGRITLEGAAGLITVHTDFGDAEVTRAEEVTLTELSTNSGNILFSGSLGDGPHKIKTDFGEVRLKIPEDSALTVDLKTDFGRIKSDLPITLIGDQENDHWLGEVNGGGAALTAETNNGDITIETLNP